MPQDDLAGVIIAPRGGGIKSKRVPFECKRVWRGVITPESANFSPLGVEGEAFEDFQCSCRTGTFSNTGGKRVKLSRIFNRSRAPEPSGALSGFFGGMQRLTQALGVALHINMANTWRDQWNPLRSLTIARAVSYLEAGERGEYADVQWLYRFIEKRDPTLKGLIERYNGGLLKLEWKVCTLDEEELPEGATPEMADAQARDLREAYAAVDNISEALEFLVLAEFRGYAHLEKHREDEQADGKVLHLEPVAQWYWVRDGISGEWQYNDKAKSGVRYGLEVGEERLASEFIIREVPRPVNEIALLNFVFKNICKKDWAGFVEGFGIPYLFIVGPPNVPASQQASYQSIAEQIIANSRGYLPNGSDVKTGDEGARGVNPHKEFKDDLTEEVVLAGTGGKLTMLAESGSGTLAGTAHQDAWDDIIAGVAKKLSELFQRQFDKVEVLDRLHAGEPVLAYFELSPQGQDDEDEKFKRDVFKAFLADKTVVDIMANLTDLRSLTKNVGVPLNEEYKDPYVPVVDANGASLTGEVVRDAQGDVVGAKPTTAATPGEPPKGGTPNGGLPAKAGSNDVAIANRGTGVPATLENGALQKAGASLVARALATDLQPLRTRIERILEINDPEVLTNRLSALLTEMDSLGKDISADPEVAKALAAIQASAIVDGMEQGKLSREKAQKSQSPHAGQALL